MPPSFIYHGTAARRDAAGRYLPFARNAAQTLKVPHYMQLEVILTYGRDSFSRLPERGASGRANRGIPMDPQLPSSRFLIGLISAVWQAPVASISSRDGTSGGSCSTSISVRYMQLPHPKGSGIHSHSLPSTPLLPGVFSLRSSCFYSNLTSHIAEFVVCSSQSYLWVSSETSCRRPQELQWHQSQLYKRYATSYSRHQSEVRDTSRQSPASDASEAKKESHPSATGATSNLLQSLLGLRTEASLSLREAKQEACSLFSIDIMYVTSDIESNEAHIYLTAPTADNNREEDARHCIYIVLASRRCSQSRRFAPSLVRNSSTFFLTLQLPSHLNIGGNYHGLSV